MLKCHWMTSQLFNFCSPCGDVGWLPNPLRWYYCITVYRDCQQLIVIFFWSVRTLLVSQTKYISYWHLQSYHGITWLSRTFFIKNDKNILSLLYIIHFYWFLPFEKKYFFNLRKNGKIPCQNVCSGVAKTEKDPMAAEYAYS